MVAHLLRPQLLALAREHQQADQHLQRLFLEALLQIQQLQVGPHLVLKAMVLLQLRFLLVPGLTTKIRPRPSHLLDRELLTLGLPLQLP